MSKTDDLSVRRAAVLIPLIEENGAYSLLYEVRAYDLDVQPGDVCFPGGIVEEGETAEETVLREAEEELLIDRRQITLAKTLPEVNGPGAVVTPFAGILKAYAGTFSENEVDHVFTVPVSYLKDHPPAVYESYYEQRLPDDFPYDKIFGGKNYPFRGVRHEVLFYDIPEAERSIYGKKAEQGDRRTVPLSSYVPCLWGFTAKLTRFFLAHYANVISCQTKNA